MPLPRRTEQKKADHAAPLPSGTVTFLLSDIEGSTQRWENQRDSMQAAVQRHERLVRHSFKQHGGYIFKALGDGLCCAFGTAPSAVRAALDAQLALAQEDFSAREGGLRVRMALHTGYSEERDADYLGPTVNRVARLMSIGHGSQVLLSRVTYDLVRDAALTGVTFTDLGQHRLKDLAQPEHVWQATVSGLPCDFPPLKSLDVWPNNLPLQVTTFHGREHDLEELKGHLSEHRLVTLFGAGGVGKSRLAVQVGADLLDAFSDGVWIADLAPITDSQLVASVIAGALGGSQAEGPVESSIPHWLRAKQLLLILDNCEHVLETAAQLANTIHCNCPQVRILATSRSVLGVSGEKVLRVASLAVPSATSNLTPLAAMQFGAISLFADRASLVDQAFALSAENVGTVADICRRLDGIPLAIELAAARINVLSVSNLLKHLNERFKILTGGSRTALPRQKTLAALIDWSYDLLSPQERTLFNRLAVFAGSITLDAATAVCAGDGIDEIDVLDLTASLADKSLVVVDTTSTPERYRLLESTRQYAWEKLRLSGECETVARCHAEYFLGLARDAEASLGTMPLSEWLARLDLELENLRAVLEWALSKGQDVALGGAIVGALEMFWWHGGLEAEGRRWIEGALAQIDESKHADIVSRLRQALAVITSRVLFS